MMLNHALEIMGMKAGVACCKKLSWLLPREDEGKHDIPPVRIVGVLS
jgi:hypothetical protein